MEITREILLQRRAELAENVKTAEANLYAHQGALQDTDHWLAVFDAEPVEEPTE